MSAITNASDLLEFTKKQQRNVNCLTDPNRSTRRRALIKFAKEFKTKPKPNEIQIQAQFFIQSIQSPLITCLSDDVEKCRELSCTILTYFVNEILITTEHHEAIITLFEMIVPVLTIRVGSIPFAEPTEEIRLCLMELLTTMLTHPAIATSPKINEQGPDLLAIYARASQDAFPDVKKACAKGVKILSQVAPLNLHSNMGKCVVSLIANLSHQHSRVRCLTLDALATLLPTGGERLESLMNEKVLTAFRSVSADHSGVVRKMVVTTAAKLCTDLPMAHRFHADLLPLILGGIADEADDVKEHAARTMCELGSTANNTQTTESSNNIDTTKDLALQVAQQAANESELEQKQTTTDPEDSKTDAVFENVIVEKDDPAEAERLAALIPTLGAPFDKVTPSPEAKRMVQRLLPSLLPPVLRELNEWTVARRSHAAGVLSAILVFAEGHAVSFIPDILSALGNSCRDEEIRVAGRAFSWYVTFFFF